MHGWLDRWARNGWRTASGNRVRHSDIWKRVRRWLTLFDHSLTRRVEVLHVRAHTGINGNERADKLAKLGAKLRFDVMVKDSPTNWNERTKNLYWENRT